MGSTHRRSGRSCSHRALAVATVASVGRNPDPSAEHSPWVSVKPVACLPGIPTGSSPPPRVNIDPVAVIVLVPLVLTSEVRSKVTTLAAKRRAISEERPR